MGARRFPPGCKSFDDARVERKTKNENRPNEFYRLHYRNGAVIETCPRIRADAGELLADFVKAKLLSKLIVCLG